MGLPYQAQDLDGMTPSRGHPDGKNLAKDLVARANDVRGSATILAGQNNVVLSFDAAYNGLPVLTSLTGAADGTLTSIVSTVWNGTGGLTITGNANATGNKTLAYQVLAPLPTV